MRAGLLFQYRLLTAALTPVAALHALVQALRQREFRYLRERLGLHARASIRAPLWVHAASVGEVNAVLPLVSEFRRRHPSTIVLLTTSTPTGGAVARARSPSGVTHAYLPFDRNGGVRRFLDRFRPQCGIVVETELWPNLYAACAARNIPLLVVNGRVSARTLNAPVWLRDLYAGCLGSARAVLARSERDQAGFLALGAPPQNVQVLGNLKFAAATPGSAPNEPMALRRPYVLAASTRDGEETQVLQAWRSADRGEHLLVIAPRHPKRRDEILGELEPLSARLAVRSRGDHVDATTEIYLADTLGELERFMAGADLVFMGGSLVKKGGHNVLEPARLGRPLVFGPHMENFADEAQLLLAADAAVQVGDAAELGQVITTLLADESRRTALGASARAAVAAQADVAIRYLDALERLCPPAPSHVEARA